MRRTKTLLSLSLIVLLSACGDDGGSGGTDGGGAAADADPNAPDADPNAPDADTTLADAGPSPDGAVGVTCGEMICDPDQDCCVNAGGGGSECVAAGTCGGVTFECDGAEDCPDGETCCGGGAGGSECVADGTCEQPTCDTMEDCPNENQMCCEIGMTKICQVTCPGG